MHWPKSEKGQLMELDLGGVAQYTKTASWWMPSTSNKAHRSKKEMQEMSLFEKFTTEGTESR